MTQDLSYMSMLTEESFERERARLIRDHILSLPEGQRKRIYAYQCQIDVARMTLSSEEFLKWMAREAHNLAENLVDAIGQLNGILVGPPTVKPAAER
jgi:hypothetical protein